MKRLIKKLSGTFVATAVMLGLIGVTATLVSPTVYADHNPTHSVQSGVTDIGGDSDGRRAGAFTGTIKNVINILLFIIGAAAVIMIIIGGIRYVVSGGDQGAVTGAKNTILYAVVGLVIAIMAYSIVNFVVTKL